MAILEGGGQNDQGPISRVRFQYTAITGPVYVQAPGTATVRGEQGVGYVGRVQLRQYASLFAPVLVPTPPTIIVSGVQGPGVLTRVVTHQYQALFEPINFAAAAPPTGNPWYYFTQQ